MQRMSIVYKDKRIYMFLISKQAYLLILEKVLVIPQLMLLIMQIHGRDKN